MPIPDQVIVHGWLKADGTVELGSKPPLPVGPVEIIIRSLSAAPAQSEDWWQYLQRARRELEAAGHRFRTKEEIDATLTDLRSGDERIESAYGRTKEFEQLHM